MSTPETINKWLYGTENPTYQEKWLEGGGTVLIVSAIYAYWSDFAPTEKTFFFGAALGILSGLILYGWACFTIPSKTLLNGSRIQRLIQFAIISALFCYLFSLLYIYTLPSIATRVIGDKFSEDRHFVKHQKAIDRERKLDRLTTTCEYRIRSELNQYAFPSYFCLSERNFRAPSDTFWADGYESVLGSHYSSLVGISKYDSRLIEKYGLPK